MKKDAQEHSAEDRKRREEVDAKNQADTLVFQTRKQVKEFGDKLPADLKGKVESAADALDAAVKSGNHSEIKAKMEALNGVWNETSSAMYQSATAGQPAGTPPPPRDSQEQPADGGKKVEDASFEVMDDKK